MATLFLQYPACSTCQKAKKWLTENNIEFTNRLIVEENPTVEELKAWIPRSGLPVKKFFNTSGLVYKELKLSEKLPAMSEEEQIALLATNGKLVKRPLVVTDSTTAFAAIFALSPTLKGPRTLAPEPTITLLPSVG